MLYPADYPFVMLNYGLMVPFSAKDIEVWIDSDHKQIELWTDPITPIGFIEPKKWFPLPSGTIYLGSVNGANGSVAVKAYYRAQQSKYLM
jgi:hypothetical protein